MKRRIGLGLIVLFGLSLLAACGDDDDSNTASDVKEANTAFCQDLSAYTDALAALGDLDPATATKGEYEDAADAVKSARSDLSESGADLVEAEYNNVKAQAEDLEGALADASDDAAVADILAAAQQQVTEVKASAASLNTAVCNATNSTTTAG